MRGRRSSLLFLGVAFLAALVVLPMSSADALFPVLEVSQDSHLLSAADDVSFEAYDLDAAANTEALTIHTPAGYNLSLTHNVGLQLGDAQLGTVSKADGPVTDYNGQLQPMDPAAYAADPNAQACAPGTHTAVWILAMSGKAGSLSIPVAVDRATKGYNLTICLGAVHALNLQTSYVWFDADTVFRNPSTKGTYLFDATVTPYDAAGLANTAADYELRGYELLPQLLTAAPAYDAATHTLTVGGTLSVEGKARTSTNVHIFAGMSTNSDDMKEIGVAATTKDGSFTFTKAAAKPFKYMYAQVNHYRWPTCPGTSSAPGGCSSYSIDGRSTDVTKIVSVKL